MHAGEHDDICIDRHCLAGQRQAVADDTGQAVEDLGCLIVARMTALRSRFNARMASTVIAEGRPFHRGDDSAGQDVRPQTILGRVTSATTAAGSQITVQVDDSTVVWGELLLLIRSKCGRGARARKLRSRSDREASAARQRRGTRRAGRSGERLGSLSRASAARQRLRQGHQ